MTEDDGVLMVMAAWAPTEGELDEVKAVLNEAMAEKGHKQSQVFLGEVGFEVIPACEAPGVVVGLHGVGGWTLPYLAEHPEGYLILASVGVDAPSDPTAICQCCDRPLG